MRVVKGKSEQAYWVLQLKHASSFLNSLTYFLLLMHFKKQNKTLQCLFSSVFKIKFSTPEKSVLLVGKNTLFNIPKIVCMSLRSSADFHFLFLFRELQL